MSNNSKLVNVSQLESVVSAVKDFTLSQIGGEQAFECIQATNFFTSAWTGVTKDSTLTQGKIILFSLSNPWSVVRPELSTERVTLNLTLAGGGTTGAKPVRYTSSGATEYKDVSTEFNAHAVAVWLCYDGSAWFVINYLGRTPALQNESYIYLFEEFNGVWFIGAHEINSSGVYYARITAGTVLNISFPVFLATSADGTLAENTLLYINTADLTSNYSQNGRTITAAAPLYIKGTLSGTTFTVHSDILTTTLPTTEDGFVYLYVGNTRSNLGDVTVDLTNQKYFAYKNGAFQQINPFALKAESDARGQQIDSTYIKGISGSNGVLTLTKGDNTSSTVSCGLPEGCILDTVPATVNGGMWFEVSGGEPTVKFYYGGNSYSLTTTIDEIDPQLTLSPGEQTISSGTDATINVSYLGNGTVTVSAQGVGASHSPSYSNGVITLPFNHTEATAGGSVTVTAGLSASSPYSAATATAIVYMSLTNGGESVIDGPM